MLYDPKWNQEAKAEPLSLESLIAWLEKQSADTEYDSGNPHKCLFAQYLGRTAPALLSVEYGRDATDIAYGEPNTFGAALERARDLQNKA